MSLNIDDTPAQALQAALYEELQDWRFMTEDLTLVNSIIEDLREAGWEILPVAAR